MVFGLESVSDIKTVLTSSNYIREEFNQHFPFPLVLWVNDDVLKKLLRIAPDLKSWASSVEFNLTTDELLDFLRQEIDEIFVCNSILHLENCFELDAAWKDLQSRRQVLEPELEARIEFFRGLDDFRHDRIEQALAHYQKSLALPNLGVERQGFLLLNIARCYYRKAELNRSESQKCWEESRNYFQKCLDTFEQAQRSDLVAKHINQLGEVLRRLKAWDELKFLAEKALTLHRIHGEMRQLAQDYGFLAEVALEESSGKEANQLTQQALQLLSKIPNRKPSDWVLYTFLLARSQQHLGQIKEAIANLEQVRQNYNPQYDPQLYIDLLGKLRDLYFQQGEYLKAFEIKQEKHLIKYQYGFQAFTGASHLQPKAIDSALAETAQQAVVAQEIAASGREQFVKHLIARISDNYYKLTVIHGQSGVGKSSIIRAGLVPLLKQQSIGEREALPVVLRVYTDWIKTLGRCFAEAFKEVRDKSLLATIDSKDAILKQLRLNAERNLLTVLVFDQFEEFFFVCRELNKRREFYKFLGICLDISYVKVILSLREDYLHYLLECNRLKPLEVINHNILDKDILCYLGNFSRDEAKLVIESLTNRSQFYLEPALIDELVKDLAVELDSVRPIELQVVGAQLQAKNIITLEQYKQLGDKPKAELVERYLADVVKDCGSEENRKLAQLILYLLTDENLTRPLKTRTELVADLTAAALDVEANKLDLVLKILADSGLVVRVRESTAERFQLFHDYLVSFIRQQQGTGLLAELAQAKEKQKLTEAQLRQALQQAKISEIEALSALSQVLLLSHNQLEALVASVKAGIKLKEIEAPHDVKIRTTGRLQQAIYGVVRERNRFHGHIDSVLGVSFSPNGQMLASAGQDATVKVWRIDGTLLKSLEGHQSSVIAVSFSPDGQTIASASVDKTVKLWGLDGTLYKTLHGHKNFVLAVSFSPDGQILASASRDRTIKLWSRDGTLLQTLQGHSNWVLDVSFSPDGQTLASASVDKTIKLWSRDGTLLQTLEGHKKRVLAISFSLDGQQLASASLDKTFKPWRIGNVSSKTYTYDITHKYYSAGIIAVSFSPDGRTLASASQDDTVRLLSFDQTWYGNSQWHGKGIWGMSFSPDSKIIASANYDGTVRLWSIDGTQPQTLLGHSESVTAVSFSPDGQVIASASHDKTVKLWSRDGRLLNTFQSTEHSIFVWIMDVSFSPDGQTLASCDTDMNVKLWNLDGTLLKTLGGHSDGVYSVSFSPDGKMIASASADNTVKLWSTNGALLETLQGHSEGVYSISFSPDGKMIASASVDNTVKLWNFDGKLLQTCQGHGDRVCNVTFSPDGQTIASASQDRTVKLWNREGTLLQTLQGHSYGVTNISFSPDGKTIASASKDYTIKLWNKEGVELQTFIGYGGCVNSVSFSPDGKTIASANDNGAVILWNLDLDDLILRGCDRLRDYLKTNQNVSESDRTLCDDITTQK